MPVPFCPFGTFGAGSVLYYWSIGGYKVILENEYIIKLSEIGKGNKVTNKAILSYLEDIGGLHSNKAGYGMFEIEETHLSWILLGWMQRVIQSGRIHIFTLYLIIYDFI